MSTALGRPADFARKLATIETIEDARNLDAELAALEQYAKRNRKDRRTQEALAIARVLVQRCGGEVVSRIEREQGTDGGGLRSVLEQSKLTRSVVHRWELLFRHVGEAEIREREKELETANPDSPVEFQVREFYKLAKTRARQAREGDRRSRAKHSGTGWNLAIGDIRRGLPKVADASLDAIVTDPPYGEEYVPLYGALGDFAARTLKPGGHCLVMTGQANLPKIIEQLTAHVTYWWTLAYYTPGGSVQVFGRKVKSNWKPVLWFWKDHLSRDQENESDVVVSTPEDDTKDRHEWGQTVSGMAEIVRRFTAPGALVADPFCGSGTTGVACLLEGRRFVGFDKDKDSIEKAARRLAQVGERAA